MVVQDSSYRDDFEKCETAETWSVKKYPPYKDGTSLLEWTLTFERLIAEYERVSSQKYSDDLKISTLLAGLPEDVRRYLQLQVSETTTYEKLRETMLAFERTSSSWSTEHVLKAIGADEPTPMDVDRVEWKGKGKGKGKEKGKKGEKGKGGWTPKGKGKGKKGDKGK